jgi:ABC-type molybdate transport system permease subunit
MGQFCTERRLTVSIGRSKIPLKVILPLLEQKALAKDMSLPFARSLGGLNIRAHS